MKRHKAFGPNPGDLRLLLCDTNPAVVDAWKYAFRDCDAAEIWEGNLFDLDADAMVSPANSFGDMGGGIDQAIDRFYEERAQDRVMGIIRQEFFGELPVGMAFTLHMKTERFPHLIVAPTMRIPGEISGTINIYLAFRAVLVAVLKFNRTNTAKIRTIAVPGLGTGVGGMDPGLAAEQMQVAWVNVIEGGWEKIVHPAMAPYAFRDRSVRFD